MLDTLAVEIREEVEAAEADFQSAVAHAVRAGELLTEAKSQVRHGEWLPWIEANFPGSVRSAQGYMRLADNAEDAQRVAHLGIKGALKQLAAPAPDRLAKAEEYITQGDEYFAAAEEHFRLAEVAAESAPNRYELLDQLQAMLPDLDGAEWESFKRSIEKMGVLKPVVKDHHGRIIDGRQRVRAATELGLQYRADVVKIDPVGAAGMCFSLNVIRAHGRMTS